MSAENVSLEQHLIFVDKMRERVRGTDLEPIWERLYVLMSKISGLNEAEKIAIDTTIRKLIEKIEHFKKISQEKLEAINVDNRTENEPNVQFETTQPAENAQEASTSQEETSSSQGQQETSSGQTTKDPHVFVQPNRKFKKVKRFRMTRNEFPHIVMSPRGDNIPVLRIRLSEIHNKKRQKEERKKNKKIKENDAIKGLEQNEKDEHLPFPEQKEQNNGNAVGDEEQNGTAEENIVPDLLSCSEKLKNDSRLVEIKNKNLFLEKGIKECSIRLEQCSAQKSPDLITQVATTAQDAQKLSIQPEIPANNGTNSSEVLEKIPIERSKSLARDKSEIFDKPQFIYIEDSDEDDKMEGHKYPDNSAPQKSNDSKKITPKKFNGAVPPKSHPTPPQSSSNQTTPNNATKPKTTSEKSPTKTFKNTKNQSPSLPKKVKLEDCVVTVKTVDIPVKLRQPTEIPGTSGNSKPKSPTTPKTSAKVAEITNNVSKSAPVAKLLRTKRNRNSIDTLPDPKKVAPVAQPQATKRNRNSIDALPDPKKVATIVQVQTAKGSKESNNSSPNSVARTIQNLKAATRLSSRRNSTARVPSFDGSSSNSEQMPENSNNLKITSVQSIQAPTYPDNVLSTILNAPLGITIKKLQNARKSTKSNKVLISRRLSTTENSNQTPNISSNNQNMTKNAEIGEFPVSKVNEPQTVNKIPNNVLSAIKNEPRSPKGNMTPPMTEIPTQLILFEAQKDKKLILLSAEFTLKKIRPWIEKSEHRKFLKNCENMLKNGFCLSALFKCMGSTCSYYTNNSSLFIRHLNLHHEKQANDLKYFSQCAYCCYINDKPDALVQHISEAHGNSRYQCSYCFYRSYDFHIHTHLKLFHPLKSEAIIECTPLKTVNIKNEQAKAWNNFFSLCRPFFCCVCKTKFYNIKLFEEHYKSYATVPSSRCLKCKFEITKDTIIDHLKNCHGFGNCHCAFCSFESDSSDALKLHLSKTHADKPLLYFDRTTHSENFDPKKAKSMKKDDLLKTIVLKQLIQHEPTNSKNIKIFDDQNELENADNINTGLLENKK